MSEEKKSPEAHPVLVRAFESSIGLPTEGGAIVLVEKADLEGFNKEIKEEHQPALRYHTEAASVAALFAARAIRPDEIAALRRRMFETVSKGLQEVDQVVMGTKQWTPTQVRLFAILTERVMPKLSSITVEDTTGKKKLEDLSLEELEAIALGKKKAGAVDAVIREAEVRDGQAEKSERREMKATVIRELAHITAIDEAEKKYIARQASRPMAEIEAQTIKQAAKPMPKQTEEQVASRRASSARLETYWRNRGHSEEEIAAKAKARLDKIAETKAELRKQKEEAIRRVAVKNGLGDAEEVAEDISRFRAQTMREFRVHNRKGARTQASLVREAERRGREAEKLKQKGLNPLISKHLKLEGIPPEEREGLRLQRLRELRPDIFEKPPSPYVRLGDGTNEGAGIFDDEPVEKGE